jgi:hypothetical protein
MRVFHVSTAGDPPSCACDRHRLERQHALLHQTVESGQVLNAEARDRRAPRATFEGQRIGEER